MKSSEPSMGKHCRQRRFQFRLRTLFIIVTLIGVFCATAGRSLVIVRERKVFIASHRDNYGFWYRQRNNSDPVDETIPWFRRWLGDEPHYWIDLPMSTPKTERETVASLFPEASITPMPQEFGHDGPRRRKLYFFDEDCPTYPDYWQRHILVVAKLLGVRRPPNNIGPVMADFRLIATVAGALDPGAIPELTTQIPFAQFPGEYHLPENGTTVAALIVYDGLTTQLIPASTVSMFEPYVPLMPLSGDSDFRRLEEVLSKVQKCRKELGEPHRNLADELLSIRHDLPYWVGHSLVYGEICGTTEARGAHPSLNIDFRPVMTLSGNFDPSTTPQLSAIADIKYSRPQSKSPPFGPHSLVLLVRHGKSWAVASEQPQFMPGDHTPICEVKDFDDKKVSDTLKAIQQLREKDSAANSDAAKP